jgi:hypothetical protein
MSIAFRKTVAALAFSEAAANVILNLPDKNEEVLESARTIKKYCKDAYPLINERLKERDIKRFHRASVMCGMNWDAEQYIDMQKMISWCSFLMDEPFQRTRRPKLKSCLGSIIDLLMHILGILEERDGGPRWGPIDEANETYIKWESAGWI